jgi:hypothetical protein
MLMGGCFCGSVRYESGRPLYAPTLCHCRSCQRASGAHAVGWYTVRPDTWRVTAGGLVERQSSLGVWRGYCANCHSPLTYRVATRPLEIDVTIASLDDPGAVAPADHIYMADAAAWDEPSDGLPQFLATRAPDSSSSQGEG